MTLIFLVSFGTALLAIVSGWLQYKEQIASAEKELANEKKLNELHEELASKSDGIIDLQNKTQAKTDEILIIQNKLQEKTELTVELNQRLLENQIKISSDYERGLNPMFPMSISMDIEFSFSNYIFSKEFLDGIYSIKNDIENGNEYNKQDIDVQWNEQRNEILELDYSDASKFPAHGSIRLFFKEREFDIRLQDVFGGRNDELQNKSIIFSGFLTHSFGSLGGNAIAMINFDTKKITIRCEYSGVTLFEPKNNRPIGVSDLQDNYLLISPNIFLGDYKISRLHIKGGSIYSQYSLYVIFSETDLHKTDEYIEYIHKLKEEEINTTRTRQSFK